MAHWKERGGPTDGEEGTKRGADSTGTASRESGNRVADICREHVVSEATLYVWEKKYSGFALTEPEVFARQRVTITAPRLGGIRLHGTIYQRYQVEPVEP